VDTDGGLPRARLAATTRLEALRTDLAALLNP
jgi:hypothetical protein